MMVIIVAMIMVMVVDPAGDRRPRHITNRSARCGADRPTDNGAGPCPHQSFIEPLSGHRGASSEHNPNEER
jgi:hypothetical protein